MGSTELLPIRVPYWNARFAQYSKQILVPNMYHASSGPFKFKRWRRGRHLKHVIRYVIPPLLKTIIIETIGFLANISRCMLCTLPDSVGDSSRHFVEDLRKLTENRTNFSVIGDLNARHILWRNPTCNKNGKLLTDYLGTAEYNR